MKKADQDRKLAGASREPSSASCATQEPTSPTTLSASVLPSFSSGYQRRKAKQLAGVLILAAAAMPFPLPMTQLAELAARMSHREWVTVSLQAGVPVAEHAARVLTIAYLARLAS
jgi:hypothetical protein